MNRVIALLSRLLGNEWRDISTAPFDREIEVAVINGDINLPGSPCLRHGKIWLDAGTLRPIAVTATHWRYRRQPTPPMGCC